MNHRKRNTMDIFEYCIMFCTHTKKENRELQSTIILIINIIIQGWQIDRGRKMLKPFSFLSILSVNQIL